MACSWVIAMESSRVVVVAVAEASAVNGAAEQVVHCGYTWQVESEAQQQGSFEVFGEPTRRTTRVEN